MLTILLTTGKARAKEIVPKLVSLVNCLKECVFFFHFSEILFFFKNVSAQWSNEFQKHRGFHKEMRERKPAIWNASSTLCWVWSGSKNYSTLTDGIHAPIQKVLPEGSNSDIFFYEGRKEERIQIALRPLSARWQSAILMALAGGPMMAQHWMLAW